MRFTGFGCAVTAARRVVRCASMETGPAMETTLGEALRTSGVAGTVAAYDLDPFLRAVPPLTGTQHCARIRALLRRLRRGRM
jgi:hypothetical protein